MFIKIPVSFLHMSTELFDKDHLAEYETKREITFASIKEVILLGQFYN